MLIIFLFIVASIANILASTLEKGGLSLRSKHWGLRKGLREEGSFCL